MDTLPDLVIDGVVASALGLEPSLRVVFLSSLGTRFHASACRLLFNAITVQDDARQFSTKCAISTVISSPKRYAHHVKTITVRESDSPYSPSSDPLDADTISFILRTCGNLEELEWRSSLPPPDGLCEMLALCNPRLTRFVYDPRRPRTPTTQALSPRGGPVKWDAPSLPLLLSVTTLHLSHLSQTGARALSSLLYRIGEYSLEDLSVDFVWLDDALCENIAQAGRRIRKLKIGTSGTKLSDKGVTAIVEGCEALEELVFENVQGRLSRTLWSKPTHFPVSLTTFNITFCEDGGPHHSWTADHLLSLSSLPFRSLTSVSIVRREAAPRLVRAIPVYDIPTDDVLSLRPVPAGLITALDSRSLLRLECDWWSLTTSDLKSVIEHCPNLEAIKLCLDDPFSKLLTLSSTFATLPRLHTLSVSVNPSCAPGTPPVPLLPLPQSSLPTPTDSPILKSKSFLPHLLDFDQIHNTCIVPGIDNDVGDPSMPLMRDVKRFVRKCPQLRLLEWYGRFGRGSWVITRPSGPNCKLSSIAVEYQPPSISSTGWIAMMQERSAEQAALEVPARMERVGQKWIGSIADELVAERLAHKEKEDRNKEKRLRISSVPSLDSADALSSPTKSSHRKSSSSSVLLTPPPSASSSISAMLSTTAESISSDEFGPTLAAAVMRKRAPSEPAKQASTGTDRARARSATSSFTSVDVAVSPSSKPIRGRGRGGASASGGGGGDRKKVMSSGGTETGGGSARGRGRGAAKSGSQRGRRAAL